MKPQKAKIKGNESPKVKMKRNKGPKGQNEKNKAKQGYVPLCPAMSGHMAGQLVGQGGGTKKRDRTSHHKAGPAGHSGTSPVPPYGGTAPEDVFKYCPAPWRDKLSVHYLLGPFFVNRAVLTKTLRLACIVEGPRWGSPISCLVFCRVGPPKRKRPKEENWWCSMARRSP